MMERDAFAKELGTMVEDLLRARADADPDFISRIADGASFEGWLCFETRHELEKQRRALGLDRDTVWIGNEYKKVDLGILEYDTPAMDTGETWLAAIEFKLIYNNKNWEAKCAEIVADLTPARAVKAELKPKWRFAFVAIVRADFIKNPYQRALDRAEDWDKRFRTCLLSSADSIWKSGTFDLPPSPWLQKSPAAPHTLHFEILVPKDSYAGGLSSSW